jgi:hypothetical protein
MTKHKGKMPMPTASKKKEFRKKNDSKMGMGGPGGPSMLKKKLKGVVI